MSTPYQNTSDTPFTYIPAAPTPSLPTPDPSQAAGSSSQVTAPPAQPQPRQAEEARKDKSLAEFLLMLDDYEPLVRWVERVGDPRQQRPTELWLRHEPPYSRNRLIGSQRGHGLLSATSWV